ncbi:MAG: BREX-3 system phosphatase PglZ [Leptospiraceae bacterium]|nr:BREX-3 system phosphatase PglZ [Leptospiraceae bacterium]
MNTKEKNWRDGILKDFAPNVSRLTLVSDQDQLLVEEVLSLNLQNQGFEIMEFQDAFEFRYAYESKYRKIWDDGKQTDLIVILRVDNEDLNFLPYDLLQTGRKLTYSLGSIFPNLSYRVISILDKSLLDLLFDAQSRNPPKTLGDQSTCDYILKSVYQIDANRISDELELLKLLFSIHYKSIQFPNLIREWLLSQLENKLFLSSWPIRLLLSESNAFWEFIQERWPIFLENYGQDNNSDNTYNLKHSGPIHIPFDHLDIKVYMDNLFLEKRLEPIRFDSPHWEKDSWVNVGIRKTNKEEIEKDIQKLFSQVDSVVPTGDSLHSNWLKFALMRSNLLFQYYKYPESIDLSQYKEFEEKVFTNFDTWMTNSYSSIFNLSSSEPPMVHRISKFILRQMQEKKTKKVALLVLDGLALTQWFPIRDQIKSDIQNFDLLESATFAWVPTLTSVSRQAIFSGKTPNVFSKTIKTTNHEENYWKKFWEEEGFKKSEVIYNRGLGMEELPEDLKNKISSKDVKVIGLVVDTIDKLLHNNHFGQRELIQNIQIWNEKKFMSNLIQLLLDNSYSIWITADHGNIESIGKGRISDGVIPSEKGERVRVYDSSIIRENTIKQYSFAREWNHQGLPQNYFPILSNQNYAFLSEGEKVIAHGGASIDEVVVPLIRITSQ